MLTDKNDGPKVPISWFTKSLLKYTPVYIELLFIAICLRLLGLVEPFIFQVIIDRVIPFQREASLLAVVVVFLMVSIFQIGFEVLSALLGIIVTNNVVKELANRLYDHLLKLPISYFHKWSVGEIIARLSETDVIRRFLVGTSTSI